VLLESEKLLKTLDEDVDTGRVVFNSAVVESEDADESAVAVLSPDADYLRRVGLVDTEGSTVVESVATDELVVFVLD
jgi:hypothetical protein